MLIVRSTKGRPNKFDLVQICYINDFAVGSLARLLAQLPQPPVRGYDLRRRDRWHGAVEWHVHEIELALEPEHLTGQLARLCRQECPAPTTPAPSRWWRQARDERGAYEVKPLPR